MPTNEFLTGVWWGQGGWLLPGEEQTAVSLSRLALCAGTIHDPMRTNGRCCRQGKR
ncbi:MAG: hypothetical protein KDE56_04215 [Anaerolineales bacterium]|nr:hypothetical protein [Anaerolineales bacterium]